MRIYANATTSALLDAIWLRNDKPVYVVFEAAEHPADTGVYRRGKSGQWYRPKPLGLAALPVVERRIIASMGGQTAQALGTAHRWTPEQAREAGRKGGIAVAAIPGRMAALGRKGGFEASKDREHMREIGRRGGVAVSRNRKYMAALGRKGGAAKVGRAA